MKISQQERIESLKAGAIAGVAFCLTYGLIGSVKMLDRALFPEPAPLAAVFSWGGAWASGFLFGVTYRYIVRDEDNPHLKSGAVAAFAIARGLAPIALEPSLSDRLPIWGLFGVESLLCYFCAFLAMDLALRRGWVEAIAARPQPVITGDRQSSSENLPKSPADNR